MNLDLRVPMGLMFTIVGAILACFGAATNDNMALYAKSLGINANLWWGIVLFIFGLAMFILGRRGQKRFAAQPDSQDDVPQRRGHGH